MNTATPAHPANNFDFVRIVAATLVLYSHQYALSGQMEPSFFGLHSFGGFAVLIFFAISGYLVTQSWYSDPNILRFALRRLLRIWPALAVVVTLTALVLGPVVSSLPAADYYAHGGTWQYFLNLRFIAVYILPEAFVKNPYPLGVNGSIWTIPIEVLCYLVLAVCGLAGLLKKKTIWLAAIVIYLAWYLAQSNPDLYHSIHQKREMGAYFLSGSALYVLREYWQKRPWTWLAALALLAGGLLLAKMRYTALLAFMPYAVISLGTASTPFIRRFGRYGDFSYGIYLFAFPVQQTVIMCLYPEYGFWTAMMLSMAITAGLAFLSWHLVEKPALRFKPSKNTMSNTRFCLPERINFYALYLALFAVYFSYLLIFWPGILGEDSLAILLEVESNREFQSGKPIFWYLFVNSFYKPFNLVEIPVIVQILVATAILARILTYVYNENGKNHFSFCWYSSPWLRTSYFIQRVYILMAFMRAPWLASCLRHGYALGTKLSQGCPSSFCSYPFLLRFSRAPMESQYHCANRSGGCHPHSKTAIGTGSRLTGLGNGRLLWGCQSQAQNAYRNGVSRRPV